MPPLFRLLFEEIREYGIVRPNSASNSFTSLILDVNILVLSLHVLLVLAVLPLSKTSINDWDVELVVLMELVCQVFDVSEIIWVSFKVPVRVHPVNITPLPVKRQIVLRIVTKNVSDIVSVLVPPFALMPSKGPLWDHHWSAHNVLVVSCDQVTSVVLFTHNNVNVSNSPRGSSLDLGINLLLRISIDIEPKINTSSVVHENSVVVAQVL